MAAEEDSRFIAIWTHQQDEMAKTPSSQTTSILVSYSAAGVFWGAFAAAAPFFQAQSGLDAAGFGLLLLAMTSGAVPPW